MVEWRTPDVTRSDVRRVAGREFPGRADLVLGILEEAGDPRSRLAVLRLANGNLDRVRHLSHEACLDYRDVVGPAEHSNLYRTPNFYALPADAQQRVLDRDWQQYQAWLKSSATRRVGWPMLLGAVMLLALLARVLSP